jgi:tRNA(Arg) A34 adenosine deaminase TadA
MSSAGDHERYMRIAIDLACSELGRKEGRPFGAVIVKGGEVLGSGCNRAVLDSDPTAHAEIVAIRAACRKLQSHRLDGSVMYSSCEPCPMCLSAIYWAGIKELYFGSSSQKAEQFGFGDRALYRELYMPGESRQLKSVQLLEHEALRAFEVWTTAGGTASMVADWK